MTVSEVDAAAVGDVIKSLRRYVSRSCAVVLNVTDTKALDAALDTVETENIFKLFVSDPEIASLIVQKKHKRALKVDEDASLVKDNEVFAFELQMKPMEDSNGA